MQFTVSQPCSDGGVNPYRCPNFARNIGLGYPDAHCSVALYIAVAPNRTNARPGAADVPAQQKEIDDFANRSHRIPVLRQAHRPTANDIRGFQHDIGRFSDLLSGEPAAVQYLLPPCSFQRSRQFIKTGSVSGDEFVIENLPGSFAFFHQELFHDALEQSEVPVDFNLEPEIRKLSALAKERCRGF